MGAALVPLVIFAAVVLVLLFRSLVVVPPDKAYVIEKLGRFDRVLTPGLHIVTPFVSRVAARVPLGDDLVEVPAATSSLRSGSETSVSGVVTFRVTDAARAVTRVADYRTALASTAASEWGKAIGASDELTVIDQVREAEPRIRAAVEDWGLTIIEIQPVIKLAPEAMRALAAQAEQEQDHRIAAWVAERRQRLGADGRPTEAQRVAYREWLDLELRVHADEIAEARRLAERSES